MAKKIGWALVSLVAGIMQVAGVVQIIGLLPLRELEQWGLAGYSEMIGFGCVLRALSDLRVSVFSSVFIGFGCMASGLLLLFPRTASLGLLLASSFWGGAICTKIITGASYAVPAVLLLATWTGAALRDQRVFWSFQKRTESDA